MIQRCCRYQQGCCNSQWKTATGNQGEILARVQPLRFSKTGSHWMIVSGAASLNQVNSKVDFKRSAKTSLMLTFLQF